MTDAQKLHARKIIRYVEEELNKIDYLTGDQEDPNGEIEIDQDRTIYDVILEEMPRVIEKVAEMVQEAPKADECRKVK